MDHSGLDDYCEHHDTITTVIPVATVGLNHHADDARLFPLMRYSRNFASPFFGASLTVFSLFGVLISPDMASYMQFTEVSSAYSHLGLTPSSP
jgi:hypothetical protein